MQNTTVTIVGAGMAGLVLARILQTHDVPVVVLDQEAGAHVRIQGGLLDIHDHTGRHALRAAGLEEAFTALVQPGGQARRVLDSDAVVRWSSAGPGWRPEVDRGDLRDLLLASLRPGTVRWGTKLTAVVARGRGGHDLQLADGSVITAEFVVGADGAWSRARAAVTDVPAHYTGVTSVEACLQDAPRSHPDAAETVGDGNFFVPGRGGAIVGHHEAGGTIRARAMIDVPEHWITRTELAGARGTAAVLEHYPDWAPVLRSLVADSDTALIARPIHTVPTGSRWAPRPGITLVGDAAHVMSPFAGEGANIAMHDGALLAQALLQARGRPQRDVLDAVAAYENDMFDRADAAVAESARNLEIVMHDPHPPRGLVGVFADEHARATDAATVREG